MTDNMDIDMDVDLVLDEEEDEEVARLRAQAEAAKDSANDVAFESSTAIATDQTEEGELDSTEVVPNKVHISGLDMLNTSDIRNFVGDHFSLDKFKRVEWIDDTSANLIFEDGDTAAAALQALAVEDSMLEGDAMQAKQLATHPNAELRLRMATGLDIKQPGAKDRSRFYLLNPEYDPDMRPRTGKRQPRRDGRGNDSAKRRRHNDNYSRRSSIEEESFNVDLYDDDGGEKAQPKQSARPRKDRDLFDSKNSGRLRDRSASPAADGDGKYGFEETQPYRQTARHRSRTPPRRNGRSPQRNRELFPDKNGGPKAGQNGTKELFPSKGKSSMHPNQVADLMSDHSVSGKTRDLFSRTDQSIPKRDLFSRITSGPASTGRDGRLRADDHEREGFSIMGASKGRPESALVKELFPAKSQSKNNGADLFDGRVKGRATQRRRAEDLF